MSRLRALLLVALAPLLGAGCFGELDETPEVFDPEVEPQSCVGKCDGGPVVGILESLPSATLATRFAPYERPLDWDATLIHRITEARKADPATYVEGQNPYRIRYAVYNLRNLTLTNMLADAEDAGVDVQILIEKDQLAAERDYNITDELLRDRGFEFAEDHRSLSAEGRITADLIGVSGSGLMHLKLRSYEWPAADGPERHLVTGSMNPGDLAVNNDETLHYLRDAALHDKFLAKYDAVLTGTKLTNSWDDQAAVNVLFSPDKGVQAVDKIAQLIDQEDEFIAIAVYSLRNIKPKQGGKGIVERLADAHARGVKVVVITDRKQSDGIDADGNPLYYNDGTEEILRSAGVEVYEVINHHSPFNAMHTKYGVFGLRNPIIVTDAGNWTKAGLGSGSSSPSNDESVLIIDSGKLDAGATGRRYLGNFLQILRRYDGQDPSAPGAETQLAAFAGLANWPVVPVVFATEVETFWGEHLEAVGALAELGDWRRDGAGWPLATGAGSYPQWQSEPLGLPLGTRSEFKFVRVNGDRLTWQAGPNHELIADDTDLRTGERAAW